MSSYELTEQVFNAVLQLSEDYRQFFCLKNCVEHDLVFILKEKGPEGMPLFLQDEPEEGDDENTVHTFLPIWCHEYFVHYYMKNANISADEYEMVQLALPLFKGKWAGMLEQNNIALAIMPLNSEEDFNFISADIFSKEDPANFAAAQSAAAAQNDLATASEDEDAVLVKVNAKKTKKNR